MNRKKTKSDLVYIQWFDSSITQGETCSAEDAAGVLENESAGLLVKEDDDSITIALDRCVQTQGLRCTLCVPKVNIKLIRRLRG